MTIVLVILKALTLILAIILVFLVNKTIKRISTIISNYYTSLVDKLEELKNTVITQSSAVTTIINSQQEEVVRLANKVDEGLTHCGNQTKDLKNTIVNLDSHLDARLTAPIDKINDTHNRVKTLGKSCVTSDELREIVAQVTDAAVIHGVDQVRTILEDQAKTKTASKTKKTAKTPVTEVKP